MTITPYLRQHALARIGVLKGKSSQSTHSKLLSYYERHAAKNVNGALSRRRVDAFLGVCALQEGGLSSSRLIEELHEILSRWPKLSSPHAEVFSAIELKFVARAVAGALALSKEVQILAKDLVGKIQSAGMPSRLPD